MDHRDNDNELRDRDERICRNLFYAITDEDAGRRVLQLLEDAYNANISDPGEVLSSPPASSAREGGPATSTLTSTLTTVSPSANRSPAPPTRVIPGSTQLSPAPIAANNSGEAKETGRGPTTRAASRAAAAASKSQQPAQPAKPADSVVKKPSNIMQPPTTPSRASTSVIRAPTMAEAAQQVNSPLVATPSPARPFPSLPGSGGVKSVLQGLGREREIPAWLPEFEPKDGDDSRVETLKSSERAARQSRPETLANVSPVARPQFTFPTQTSTGTSSQNTTPQKQLRQLASQGSNLAPQQASATTGPSPRGQAAPSPDPDETEAEEVTETPTRPSLPRKRGTKENPFRTGK